VPYVRFLLVIQACCDFKAFMNSESIIQALNWRYATKKFDPARKVSAADLKILAESVRLAPTSFGLQPFRLLTITNADQRAKLVAASWGQHQVQEASHLLIFATLTTLDAAYVDHYTNQICRTRGVAQEKLESYANMMKGFLQGLSSERLRDWACKQAYIASGFLMETAALLKIDCCPMEGFVAEQYDAILGLEKRGLTTALVMPVGYRADTDHHAEAAKVRIPEDEMMITI
jgi:nitroreductase